MADELRQARRAAAKGRTEEALVHLWNALEPARLEGDASALEAIGRLAGGIREKGEPAQRGEAERLLEALQREGTAWEEAPVAVDEAFRPAGEVEGTAAPVDDLEAGAAEVSAPADAGEENQEAESPRRSSFARLLVPLLFLIVVVVNVLRRILDDN